MAIVSKFMRGATSLDLNDGEDGFQLAGMGWLPAVVTPIYLGNPGPIVETMYLLLQRSTQDNISTYMQDLHQMQVWAEQYINDSVEDTPVWLHAQMASETGERRALVRRIDIQYGASWYGDEATALDIPLTITVVREPWWERTTARDMPEGSPSADVCVTYDYTAAGTGGDPVAHDIVGDTGARIRYLRIFPGTSDELHKIWIGIKSVNRHGITIANFQPIWELEDGINETDVSDTADSSASDGNRITVSESVREWDDTWNGVLKLTYLAATGIASSSSDHVGNYLWLLRGKTSAASTTWDVRLKFGHTQTTDANYILGPIQEFDDNSGWEFKEMGLQEYPIRRQKALLDADVGADVDYYFSLKIEARRTSGSGDLYLDCVCLVPVDEGFLYGEIVDGTVTGTNDGIKIGNSPINTWFGTTVLGVSALIDEPLVMDVENLVLPPGDGRAFIVYSGSYSDKTDTILINEADGGKYYERWLSLRGSE